MSGELPKLTNQPPGTIWDLGDGRRIRFGEMKISYSTEGDKLVCRVEQEYKIIQDEWTARIYTTD